MSLLSLFAAALAGAGFGALYLGLLWAAVRRLPKDRSGVTVFVGLGLARMVMLLGALAAAAALGLPAEGLVAALAGFIVMRLAATRLLGGEQAEEATWK